MAKSRKGKPPPPAKSRRFALVASLAMVGAIASLAVIKWPRPRLAEHYVRRPPGSVTFNKDIAPILFEHCAICHHPGQAAPFALLTYVDAKKRSQQIIEVTQRRFMPPWLPEPGHVRYLGERLLSAQELGLMRQWAEEGALEGQPDDLPHAPRWTNDWQLGTPDLVIKMPEPFTVPAGGKDIYQNFAIPIPLPAARHVDAVEFRPGNAKVVHHAAMRLDRTRYSRKLDEKDPGPGFAGMSLPETTEVPSGDFLNWQPGKLPYRAPPGLGWTLEPETDFVLQLHLHPTGKPETVQSEIGFYFTDRAPTQKTFKIILDWPAINIPAGVSNYVIEDRYVLPVDVEALAVFPHAHYVAKEMQAYALLPDGARQWLLWIKDWDFNWQGDYRFAKPLQLPKGTALHMRFTYDNSTNNVRNPNQPPQRVIFGPQTTDEMGEVWVQVLPHNPADLTTLARDYNLKMVQKTVTVNQQRLQDDPADKRAHLQIGKALFILGKPKEAQPYFVMAAQQQPEHDEPHYFLGLIGRMEQQFAPARAEFEMALRLNPANYKAHGNLGLMFMDQGELMLAERHFRAALELNPQDTIARENLESILKAGTARQK